MNIDSKILKYIEGNLDKKNKENFEALIKLDADLKLRVEILSDLYNNSIPKNPSYELKEKIYNLLDIKNHSFMDIAIQKVSGIFDVLSGKDCLLDIETSLITRSNNDSLLFSKNMNDYKIFFELFNHNRVNLINFKALNINDKKSLNIKFTLKRNSNIISEKYTDINGITDTFEIDAGSYIVDISKDNSEIGHIKINIS